MKSRLMNIIKMMIVLKICVRMLFTRFTNKLYSFGKNSHIAHLGVFNILILNVKKKNMVIIQFCFCWE